MNKGSKKKNKKKKKVSCNTLCGSSNEHGGVDSSVGGKGGRRSKKLNV